MLPWFSKLSDRPVLIIVALWTSRGLPAALGCHPGHGCATEPTNCNPIRHAPLGMAGGGLDGVAASRGAEGGPSDTGDVLRSFVAGHLAERAGHLVDV